MSNIVYEKARHACFEIGVAQAKREMGAAGAGSFVPDGTYFTEAREPSDESLGYFPSPSGLDASAGLLEFSVDGTIQEWMASAGSNLSGRSLTWLLGSKMIFKGATHCYLVRLRGFGGIPKASECTPIHASIRKRTGCRVSPKGGGAIHQRPHAYILGARIVGEVGHQLSKVQIFCLKAASEFNAKTQRRRGARILKGL